jgi:hypothetical protein
VQTFRRFIGLLKKECPPSLPVKVRRVKTSKTLDADCQRKEGYFLIRIDRDLAEHEAIEALVHEWAHTLVWENTREHTNEWGKAYSKVYRILLREILR